MANFPTDSDGYLQNTGSTDLIQPEIAPLLDEIIGRCRSHLEDEIISIYVRGSVSVGEAYLHSSDVDMVLVLPEEVPRSSLTWTIPTVDELLRRYNVVSDIDITIISLERLLHDPDYARLRVYLVTRSALLWGEDILDTLPRFKPDKDLALHMYPNIEEQLTLLQQIFIGESKSRAYLGRERPNDFWCIWTMRTILRSAQALTMATEGVYDCELKACLENTVAVYPNLRAYLEQAYAWALNPTRDANTLVSFLDSYLPVFLELWHEKVEAKQSSK